MRRIREILSLLKGYKKYVCASSYYSNDVLKSKVQIFFEQLYFVLKFGQFEPFYFTYGFDRKKMTIKRICDEYIIPYYKFQYKINYLNINNPRYEGLHKKLTGRVITGDKYYFNLFLNSLGIPTPQVYLYIKDKEPLYINDLFSVDKNKDSTGLLRDFLNHDMDAFAKPSDGQLGKGIFSLKINNGEIYIDGKQSNIYAVIKMLLSADYLVQERVVQHAQISKLCSSTLNTIRLQTVMNSKGDIIPFGAIIRIARDGAVVDNWAKGGIAVGINMEDGTLMSHGIIKPAFGTSIYEHPNSHIKFEGYQIPFYKEAERLAIKLHKNLYRCHSVGWDIAITESGPVFIEGNGLWEISLIQATHGGLKKLEKYFVVSK